AERRAPEGAAPRPAAAAPYGRLPIRFEANEGQTDPAVKFLARSGGTTLFLTASEPVILLRKLAPRARTLEPRPQAPAIAAEAAVRVKLVGANPAPEAAGLEELPGRSNYFFGDDPAKWRTGVRAYARVAYREVWPGVDLVFHGEARELEYDLVLRPGADPEAIR